MRPRRGGYRSSIRRRAFFLADALRGGLVRGHLSDLERFYDEPETQDRSIADRLTRLLRHASRTTAYYAGCSGTGELCDFPLVQRKEIQGSEDRFLSSDHPQSSLIQRKTSGSYGTPLRVYVSKEKRARQYAEVIFHNERAGLAIGDRYINTTTNRKSWLETKLKNAVIVNPASIDDRWYEDTLRLLARHPDSFIIGFPSVLFSLSRFLLVSAVRSLPPLRIRGIITIAEPLSSPVKDNLEGAFQCAVYNRYATVETGVLGHSTAIDNRIHINRASYVVEVLAHDGDHAAEEGEEGRVVVTDLFSHAMPLIRYETGDSAVVVSREGRQVTCIGNPEGRTVETIFATDGTRISWAVIYDLLTATEGVVQFQFRQTGERSYHLYLVTPGVYDRKQEQVVERGLLEALGADATLEISYPKAIPPLPSGKRPMIMNTAAGGR